MDRGPMHLWNEWSTQILVVLSLALQVVLLLFAGVRRREASAVSKLVLWLAYQLADSTAIYALGLLSLSCVSLKHQLAAFWAPFLLLHLGGPDNITAYALEDSKLWLRHLLNLVVQVLGAAYILYKYVAGGDSFILLAAILMFVVGVVKYAERTLALKCSNLDSIRGSLKKEHVGYHHHFHPPNNGSIMEAIEGDEFYVRRAHSMFHICKRAIVDSVLVRVVEQKNTDNQSSSEDEDPEKQSFVMDMDIEKEKKDCEGMWALMEMELSLMYDLLYTKASVIHTWSGYGFRVASSVATAASFLLFQFSTKDGHGRVDVVVSYTLLAAAFTLETLSLLRALESTWTYAFLCNTGWSWLRYEALCIGRWDQLRSFLKGITGRRGRDKRSARRWSGTIGQYNILHVSCRYNTAYDPLLGRMARLLGYKDWWIRYHYSGTTELSEHLKRQLFKYIKRLTSMWGLNTQGVIRRNWGQNAFGFHKEMELYNSLTEQQNLLGVEFQEGIIIWHIATEVFLAESSGSDAHGEREVEKVKAIRTLSNYIIFLLVDRPYMLPGLAQSMLYRQTRGNLTDIWKLNPDSQKSNAWTQLKDFFCLQADYPNVEWKHVEELARILYKESPSATLAAPRLNFSWRVAEKLLQRMEEKGREKMLQLLLTVWIDFLVYAANRCSRESHAKKLSDGGELTTILWLMTNYFHLDVNIAEEERRGG